MHVDRLVIATCYTSFPGMHSAVSLVVNCSRKHVSSRRHFVLFLVLPSTASLFSKMRSTLIANPAMSTGMGLYIMCAHVCVCVCVCVCVYFDKGTVI